MHFVTSNIFSVSLSLSFILKTFCSVFLFCILENYHEWFSIVILTGNSFLSKLLETPEVRTTKNYEMLLISKYIRHNNASHTIIFYFLWPRIWLTDIASFDSFGYLGSKEISFHLILYILWIYQRYAMTNVKIYI